MSETTNVTLPPLEHRYATSGGVRIHYVIGGAGRPVLFLHGFPDFWYGWRHQLAALSSRFRVIAMDQRGYNLSDAPQGTESYRMERLVGDAAAVLSDAGVESAIVVGHDWGGAVAWRFAMQASETVLGLIVIATPHPRALARELARNPAQRDASAYARRFCEPGSEALLNISRLTDIISRTAEDRSVYLEAFGRSSVRAMMEYYRAGFPCEPYEDMVSELPAVRCPTRLLMGLDDAAFVPDCLNGTWAWIDAEFSLVTLPGVGHSPHVDAADRVNELLTDWVERCS